MPTDPTTTAATPGQERRADPLTTRADAWSDQRDPGRVTTTAAHRWRVAAGRNRGWTWGVEGTLRTTLFFFVGPFFVRVTQTADRTHAWQTRGCCEGGADGAKLCLREVVVTCATASDPVWLDTTVYLCLRPLPCDNPNHKPDRTSR